MSFDVSIMIATRNRAEMLRDTLACLAQQAVDGVRYLVIVCDSGSTDATRDVVEKASDTIAIEYVYECRPGKNRALNAGLTKLAGELALFTDDDTYPSRDWVQAFWIASKSWPNDDVFGGPIVPRFPQGTPDWMTRPQFPYAACAFARYTPECGEGPISALPFGPSLAIRRKVVEEHRFAEWIGPNGQRYAMGSEAELLYRLQRLGYRFTFVPDASVEHRIREEQTHMPWLKRRAFSSGRGTALLDPAADSVRRFAGVPLYMIRLCIRRLVAHPIACMRGAESHCVSAMDLQVLYGAILEFYRGRSGDTDARSKGKLAPPDSFSDRI